MPPVERDGGLFFGAEDLQLARQRRHDPAIRDALSVLDAPAPQPLDAAYLAALRNLFDDDAESAAAAAQGVQNAALNAELARTRDGCRMLIGWLSVISMLRRHPSWPTLRQRYAGLYSDSIVTLTGADDALDALWLGALQLAVGVVFADESALESGAEVYRHAVQSVIHPEGYLRGIADIPEAADGYAAQVSGTCALALMAEMAAQTDRDLWSVNNRGVTPVTATTYLHFYYFYPEKWIWGAGLTRDQTEAVLRRDGAFIEMVNRRFPLRGIEILLAELRPFFSPLAGGLTTLTHGAAPESKPRWRLW